MATSPVYAAVPLAPVVSQLATANTNLDGTGTLVEIAAGTANGVVIERLKVHATGTTTAGLIRFFLSVDNGSTKRLFHSIPVSALTPSATVQSFANIVDFFKGMLLIGTGVKLYACPTKSETFNVIAERAEL